MNPSVTIEAAETANAQSTAQPTASMKADRKELSVPRYMNMESLLRNCVTNKVGEISRVLEHLT